MIPDELRNLTNSIYILDRNYNIIDFNDGYKAFAMENEGVDILSRWPIGSNILEAIPNVIRDFIKNLHDDAIANNKIIEYEYDCHSATVFRRFKLRILPLANGYSLHDHCLIESSEMKDVHKLSDGEIASEYIDNNGIIHQCCHCRRVQSSSDTNHWVWVVSLIHRNEIFISKISHTICPVCFHHYYPE